MNAELRTGLASTAPCLPDDELQRPTDGSPGLLADSVSAAAQQNPAYESAVHSESWHQPGLSTAHPPLLSLLCFQGKRAAVVTAWLVVLMLDQEAVYAIWCDNWSCVHSHSTGKWCLRQNESVGDLVRSDCLKQVRQGTITWGKKSHKLNIFYYSFHSFFSLFHIRPVGVAAFPPARLLPFILGCRQQTGSWALLSMAEPQRQTPLQVRLRCRVLLSFFHMEFTKPTQLTVLNFMSE